MTRQLFLIAYDISCNKRRRAVYKMLLKYRVGGQKSCFECLCSTFEIEQICQLATYILDISVDRLQIFQLNPSLPIELIGVASSYSGNFMVF